MYLYVSVVAAALLLAVHHHCGVAEEHVRVFRGDEDIWHLDRKDHSGDQLLDSRASDLPGRQRYHAQLGQGLATLALCTAAARRLCGGQRT
jgi:hypothetical protein